MIGAPAAALAVRPPGASMIRRAVTGSEAVTGPDAELARIADIADIESGRQRRRIDEVYIFVVEQVPRKGFERHPRPRFDPHARVDDRARTLKGIRSEEHTSELQ